MSILPLQINFKRFDPLGCPPSRGTEGSAGWDLYACENKLVLAGWTVKIDTGIGIELPPQYEAQIRPRSSLSSYGILVHFDTVYSDYRGRLLVIMSSLGGDPYLVRAGDKIAQLVIAPVVTVAFYAAETLGDTKRGTGGYGSTGR